MDSGPWRTCAAIEAGTRLWRRSCAEDSFCELLHQRTASAVSIRSILRILSVVGTVPQLSETFLLRKAIALAERGHDVTLVARQRGDWSIYDGALSLPPSLRIEYLPPDGGWLRPSRAVRAIGLSLPRIARSPTAALSLITAPAEAADASTGVRRLARYCGFLGRQADVIHFEFIGLSRLYAGLPPLLTAPMVVSCRGNEINLLEQQPLAEQRAVIERLRSARAVHCVSQAIADIVRRTSGRESDIWVNRPAVDPAEIRPKEAYLAPEPPLIITTGRLVWKKGHDYLLTALHILHRRGVSFRAQIVGDGPMLDSLRFTIDDLGLSSIVELAGAMTPAMVLQLLRRAEIFVLSSHEEGISNAVLEAMATGLPVVSTDAGGMSEVIRDGVDGHLVRARDTMALAASLEHLIGDAAARERMGRAARERIVQEFSLHRQASVFEEMYHSVATESGDFPGHRTAVRIDA